MPEELLRSILFPAPVKGLIEGIDPASHTFPLDGSPNMENFRPQNRVWETRKGMAVWDPDSNAGTTTFPGSGSVHFLGNFYRSAGGRFRLVARGGTLYDLEQGVDTTFQSVTGGTGLSTSPQNGVYNGAQLRDRFYLTDRSGALKYYTSEPAATGSLTAVTQPAAPTVAPTTKRRRFGDLETWASVAGYTVSDASNFSVAITTADGDPEFLSAGGVAKFTIDSSGARGDTISRTATTAQSLNSSSIAFWYQQDGRRALVSFEFGVNAAAEFQSVIDPPEASQEYLHFIDVGALETLKYWRFRARKTPSAIRTLFLSRIMLPGRLFGKYRYRMTFYNPTTGAESEPSPATEFVDCSAVGISTKTTESDALEKCVELTVGTNTLPSVSTVTRVRFYRNGGVPELTVDERGQAIYARLHTGGNIDTTLAANVSAAGGSFTCPTGEGAANLSAGDWVVIEQGVAGKEELVKIASVVTGSPNDTVTLDTTTAFAIDHNSGATVKPAFLDNVSNAGIDLQTRLELERDDPPSGIHWLSRAPDGRLWAFRYASRPLGVAVSNLPTVDRTNDQDVFPAGVDPLTRQSLLQGWRFDVEGDAHGDEIMWGGFYNGVATILTRRAIYQVSAYSQADWSPTAVVRVHAGVGCIAGETVQEVGGVLYWVADGPRVVRWDGRGAPEDVSYLRLTTLLENAPAAYITNWFARGHADENGQYYRLCITPSGQTTNTKWLDYNLISDAWEPRAHYDGGGTALPWATALVWSGPSDAREFYAAHPTSGNAYQMETGSTDAGVAIKCVADTARFPFPEGFLCRGERVWVRAQPTGADTLAVRARFGNSEYRNTTDYASTDGDPAQSWNETLADTDTSEQELFQRLDFYRLRGRTVQVRLSGDFNNRPPVREIQLDYSRVRRHRLTA